jgi:RNA polymerase sigma-70 factor (ECF subfamily)
MTSAILNPQAVPATLPDVETLHALHATRVFRFLLASTRDRDLAETLTQDTFTRAWSARAQFRGDCSPITWLTRIALNLLRDHTRTNRFRFWRQASQTAIDAQSLAVHLPTGAPATDQALIAHQQLALVWQTVAELTERQRTIFLLRFVEDFELAEIVAATGLPMSTVKTHLYRALATIRARHKEAQ